MSNGFSKVGSSDPFHSPTTPTYPLSPSKRKTPTSAFRPAPATKSKTAPSRRSHLTPRGMIFALKQAALRPKPVVFRPPVQPKPTHWLDILTGAKTIRTLWRPFWPRARKPRIPKQPTPRMTPGAIRRRQVFEEYCRRLDSYKKLVEATDIDDAWKTYQELLQDRPLYLKQPIPQKYLHGFASRLTARTDWMPPARSRTQKTFLRLLSVLNTIYYTGGQVRLWEWNALIELAGTGWRKTRVADFNASLHVYQDMVANRAPGVSLSDDPFLPMHDQSPVASQRVMPDIVTYTTLLTIAARSRRETLVRRAASELASSGLSPNRTTFLTYVRYYAESGQLSGVRVTLGRMRTSRFALGMDGTNLCLWAYGRNGRLDIAGLIYRILRHHLLLENPGSKDPLEGHGDVEDAARELYELEGLRIGRRLKPDAVTYYALIQVYAYRGRLQEALTVFEHMMTSPQRITGRLLDVRVPVSGPMLPHPILPIFRALFLGFARHAVLPGHAYEYPYTVPHGERHSEEWTLDQLRTLFNHFIDLPQDARPSGRTVFWLLVAFAITSGYDRALLREVWEKLATRYGAVWDGRVEVLRTRVFQEEFDLPYFEGLRSSRDRF
ncbi:hypothetical protein GSI_00917 [Ganoderma sinense ZZ0214-1]|uniref:Uncharacterized protein n=1 Tax=Ganoderma sinense ZZ0214-1 TaxID=1077348 RepID=A0A2G8STZ6_9APHY|nr:hypothetical protein GSI_00917 [Ganoderma sinense ZZ0214-1]